MSNGKKIMAIVLSCILILSFLGTAGCTTAGEDRESDTEQMATETQANEVSIADGKYEGAGEGLNGEIRVAVTVENQKIKTVEIVSHSETAGISDAAFERIPEDIVKYQSVALDAVAGATYSSNGILEAARKALLQAGFTEAQITAEVDKEEKEEKEEETELAADVVVIGSGGAGMSAATAALQEGSTVIVLEKMPTYGGNTIVAGSGYNCADYERQSQYEMTAAQRETIESYLEMEAENSWMQEWQKEIRQDLEEYDAQGSTYVYDSPALHAIMTWIGGDEEANPELVDMLCRNAADSYEWLTQLGAEWVDGIEAGNGALWQRSHTATTKYGTSGGCFVEPQKEAFDELGGQMYLEYKAEELIEENGRIVGVKGVTGSGNEFTAMASQGVVLATGGFAANVEMRQKYNTIWPDLGESVPTTNPSSSTGDGIVMAEAVGANLVDMEYIQMVASGDPFITPIITNVAFVNSQGERFVREDGRRDEICEAVLEQPGQYFYYIMDTHTTVDLLDGMTIHGFVLDDIVDGEDIIKADTLEELAEQMGIDPDTLTNTVAEFNSYVDAGSGDPLGRATFGSRIDAGPYYANRAYANVHYCMGGVEIDTQARVIDNEGNVIPGLYAAGEVTGGIHGTNRLGGNSIADIITFGRIAGQNAAAEQRNIANES